MNTLILAAILNYSATPLCQQWTERMNQESRNAARYVWSPRKNRHIKRMNIAMENARLHCAEAPEMDNAVALQSSEGSAVIAAL